MNRRQGGSYDPFLTPVYELLVDAEAGMVRMDSGAANGSTAPLPPPPEPVRSPLCAGSTTCTSFRAVWISLSHLFFGVTHGYVADISPREPLTVTTSEPSHLSRITPGGAPRRRSLVAPTPWQDAHQPPPERRHAERHCHPRFGHAGLPHERRRSASGRSPRHRAPHHGTSPCPPPAKSGGARSFGTRGMK